MEEQLKQFQQKAQNLINENKVSDIKELLDSTVKNINRKDNPDILTYLFVEYAFLMFDLGYYEEFVYSMEKAIKLGYSKEVYKSILEEAFIQPNFETFYAIYQRNFKLLSSKIEGMLSFENLDYVIPSDEEKCYFIICKETLYLKEKINFNEMPLNSSEHKAFYDYLILSNNLYVNPSNNYLKYFIVNDLKVVCTLLQLKEMPYKVAQYIERIYSTLESFEIDFLQNTKYLPRNIINYNTDEDQILNFLKEITLKRNMLKKRPQPLLTIGIPSYNRGLRALDNVKSILKMPFDYEIEVLLSNNGTKNESTIFYEEISKISDERLTYFEFDENQGVSINICNVAKMAKSKYLLLLSDEDVINFEVLYKVMEELKEFNDEVSIYRTSSLKQHKLEQARKSKGKEALLFYGLTSNYVSGNIFRVKDLNEQKIVHYVENHQDNEICYLYPHMVFELFLTQYGDVISTNEMLIFEGDAIETNVKPKNSLEVQSNIPSYAFLEERLKQHSSFVSIFKELTILKDDITLYQQNYMKLVNKTFFLVSIAIDLHYAPNGDDILSILSKCYEHCLQKEFFLCDEQTYEIEKSKIIGVYKFFKSKYNI